MVFACKPSASNTCPFYLYNNSGEVQASTNVTRRHNSLAAGFQSPATSSAKRDCPDYAPWFCSFRLWRFINHLLTCLLLTYATINDGSKKVKMENRLTITQQVRHNYYLLLWPGQFSVRWEKEKDIETFEAPRT